MKGEREVQVLLYFKGEREVQLFFCSQSDLQLFTQYLGEKHLAGNRAHNPDALAQRATDWTRHSFKQS